MKKKIISFIALVLSDLFVIFLSFWIAFLLRTEIFPFIYYKFKEPIFPFGAFLDYYFMAIVWILIFGYEKLYTKRYSFWEEVKVILKSATLSSSLIMIAIFITRKQVQFSRPVVILAWMFSLVLFPLFRYFTKIILLRLNLFIKDLLIIGVHETSLLILEGIKRNHTLGYKVVGFLDDDPKKQGKKFSGVKVLGFIADIDKISKDYQSKDIMIVTPHTSRTRLRKLLTKCEHLSESLWLIPRSGDFFTEGVEIEVLGDVLTLSVKRNLAKPWNINIKYFYEMILTFILLILLIPMFALISAAIKIDSKGPILFIQKRLGKDKKEFSVFKFRSMDVNSQRKLIEFLSKNPEAKAEWEEYKKLKNYDPRVTKVGKFLRRYSLDELPQLFNVIQGKMSLVGPRPYLREELEGKDLFMNTIARVKPGITGLWQTRGRSELPFKERLALDEYYIRNWSLWLDIVIILKSIKVLIASKGAY